MLAALGTFPATAAEPARTPSSSPKPRRGSASGISPNPGNDTTGVSPPDDEDAERQPISAMFDRFGSYRPGALLFASGALAVAALSFAMRPCSHPHAGPSPDPAVFHSPA